MPSADASISQRAETVNTVHLCCGCWFDEALQLTRRDGTGFLDSQEKEKDFRFTLDKIEMIKYSNVFNTYLLLHS